MVPEYPAALSILIHRASITRGLYDPVSEPTSTRGLRAAFSNRIRASNQDRLAVFARDSFV